MNSQLFLERYRLVTVLTSFPGSHPAFHRLLYKKLDESLETRLECIALES